MGDAEAKDGITMNERDSNAVVGMADTLHGS